MVDYCSYFDVAQLALPVFGRSWRIATYLEGNVTSVDVVSADDEEEEGGEVVGIDVELAVLDGGEIEVMLDGETSGVKAVLTTDELAAAVGLATTASVAFGLEVEDASTLDSTGELPW